MIKPLRMRISRTPRTLRIIAASVFVSALLSAVALGRADTDPSRLVPEIEARQKPPPQARLTGEALRRFLADRRIYLSVPLGGELPLFYRADGHLDGSGEAAGLGRFLAPSDSGRWWVDGERICQKWQSWYEGRTFCFTLDLLGGDRVAWHRDDGEKGIARVGR